MRQRPTVLHVFPTFVVGGAQRRFAQITNATNQLFDHHVMAIDGRSEARVLLTGQTVFETPVSDESNLAHRLLRYCMWLNKKRPDLLITHNWGAIEWALAGQIARVPHIHIEDGFGPDEAHRQLARRVCLRRIVLRNADYIIVPSQTLVGIARRIWKLPADRVIFVPNGIEIRDTCERQYDTNRLRAELGFDNDALIIGWVGALRPEKNLNRLLSAFSCVSDRAVLVLVGDGPERASVESEAAALGISDRVRLLGARPDAAQLMSAFDMLALSSDTEQMPMVVLEAMKAGLPIASVDVGDVRNMVAAENGALICEQTQSGLAEAFSALIADAAARKRIGAANRRRVEEAFPLDRMICRYVELYDDAMSRRRAASKGSPLRIASHASVRTAGIHPRRDVEFHGDGNA